MLGHIGGTALGGEKAMIKACRKDTRRKKDNRNRRKKDKAC
jgi:hypothetical protein